MSFIRKLQTLTPNTPYGKLLNEEFGVIVPPAAPKYQQEYLYKYALNLKSTGYSNADILKVAAEKVDKLMLEFPWCMTKYESIPQTDSNGKKSHKISEKQESGTIKFNETKKMYEGYAKGRIVSVCKSIERVKHCLNKNYGINDFNIVG